MIAAKTIRRPVVFKDKQKSADGNSLTVKDVLITSIVVFAVVFVISIIVWVNMNREGANPANSNINVNIINNTGNGEPVKAQEEEYIEYEAPDISF